MHKNPKSKREYMKRYYQEHKDKWNEYRVANKDAINKSKRELYKSNSAVREYYIHMAKAYRKRNPDRLSN